MRFGQGPLSHALLVEAIETVFVPVCVFNNVKDEAEILKRYEEPSWNNPVFRFFQPDGTEILPRKDGVWTAKGLAARINEAMRKAKIDVPRWLALEAKALDADRLETATFAMYCYWEGERRLGSLDGVVTTEAGWLNKQEVVDVRFDPEVISFEKLLQTARDVKCLHNVYARTDAQVEVAKKAKVKVERSDEASTPAKDKDRHYYLKKSLFHGFPLEAAQATKVNSAVGLKQDPLVWLSPRQRELYAEFERNAKRSRK
ncbi:MAG: VPGUxxT family thioredoxin-like (seleno)protein, type 2 [Planctomycetota bacterium]|nr:VPGUxxT family thioredoxin-like (seleno)protein, type 2 [Planctomycetota bacterium]